MKKLLLPSKQELEFFIEKGASIEQIAEKYGTASGKIRKLCSENGIQLNRLDRKLITRDGHFVKSFYELSVDNWLFENNITHVYEPRLLKTRFHADFSANGFYIEIWGVKGSKAYQKRKDEKRVLYKQNNLSLIELSYFDFQTSGWKAKLSSVFKHYDSDL